MSNSSLHFSLALATVVILGTTAAVANYSDSYTDAVQQPIVRPLPGTGIGHAPYVYMDSDTGCQYLATEIAHGLVPRIAADGKTHMGCRGAAS